MNIFPRDLILNQKEERMKFLKNAFIICKAMDIAQIFQRVWDM
jgi:hypothetical protein